MTSPAQMDLQEEVLLPPGLLVLDVAERARQAALEFVHTSVMWNKSDLAMWLLGSYAQATGAHRPFGSPSAADARVDDASVKERLERARLRTRLFLKRIMTEPTLRTADQLLGLGLVCRAVDHAGGYGYIPIDRPNSELGARVVALFAADFLTRPRDYKDYLRTCHECDELYFEWDRNEGPPCHSSFPSGVIAKAGARPLGA